MDHFQYRDGALHAEGVPLEAVAEGAGTPCYIYSAATLCEHATRMRDAFAPAGASLCFSVKSCPNLAVLRLMAEMGLGMDVVSGGELERALRAGCPAERCVFAGAGKSEEEIRRALELGVGLMNVESEQEFEALSRIAASLGRGCLAALRVNPEISLDTHKYTATGVPKTKFGLPLPDAEAFFARHADDPFVRLRGIHLHIGSPISSAAPYLAALERVGALIARLRERGLEVEVLDIGGGFAADYETGASPTAAQYAQSILPALLPLVRAGVRIILEPGRSIAANAGVLLTRIRYTKVTGGHRFAICDAGMHTLLRPSHYEAFHFIWPVQPARGFLTGERRREMPIAGLEPVDVVGPLCETGDFLALARPLPPVAPGDLLAVFAAGAYGMSMASRYNSVPLPAEVMVEGGRWRIVRRRESLDEMLAQES